MHDQRLVVRLQNYWELIRRGKPMPDINQLNPGTIDDLWQQCMKLEVSATQGGHRFQYRFMGEKLITMLGKDLTGTSVDGHATHYPYSIIIKPLEAIIASQQFVTEENQLVNERGRVVKYRACFMPFGNESRGVTHIVIGFSHKEF